jgi:hypothetical protein
VKSQAAAASSPWLVGPAFDVFIYSGLILFSAAVVLALRPFIEPARLFLYFNIGFTLVHFGPTWARAYLDKAEFQRHRFQIIFFPIAFFTFAFFVRNQPLVLAFIAFFWDRWHALMQNYGFLRLYGVKSAPEQSVPARLELAFLFSSALCVMTFNMGLLTPPLAMLHQVGFIPEPTESVVRGIRVAAVVITAGVGIPYARALWRSLRGRKAAAVPKLVYLVSLVGGHALMNVTSNVFLLSAHEKVYHSTQYVALTWFYNKRRQQKAPQEVTRSFRQLFSKGPVPYLAAVAAWAAIVFGLERLLFHGPQIQEAGLPAFSTLFVGIALTHYYFDSFLWQVRQPQVRSNL